MTPLDPAAIRRAVEWIAADPNAPRYAVALAGDAEIALKLAALARWPDNIGAGLNAEIYERRAASAIAGAMRAYGGAL